MTACATISRQNAGALRLSPAVRKNISDFLSDKARLFALVEKYGSPLNLVFPQNMRENIREFQDVYKTRHIRGNIYFTSKPIKSQAILREACAEDVCVDVSSAASLHTAIECGWTPDRISATGPKGKTYLDSALSTGAHIAVDNVEELKEIVRRQSALEDKCKQKLSIRLANPGTANSIRGEDATFGIHENDIPDVLKILKEAHEEIIFTGFSYHASMAGDDQRAAAFEHLLRYTFMAMEAGLNPRRLNIGGGFRVQYARSAREWQYYIDGLKQSVLGKIPSQTWNNAGLGYRVENNAIRGDGSFVNHAPAYTGAQEFERWLNFRLSYFGNQKFCDVVRDSLLYLDIEPGRSLLDQCGVTVGQVAFVKKSARGETLVGMDMNASNLNAASFKILTEPLVIPRGEETHNIRQEGVYYMGNLCMANDMLRHNKTYPDYVPETGDLVVFMNTAAYLMDFAESEMLMQPIARKIACYQQDDAWMCMPDTEYRRVP